MKETVDFYQKTRRVNMELSFENKVVVITGGSDGIGLATAKLFAESGAKIAICGRSPEKLKLAENELRKISANVFTQSCDVTVPEQLFEFADQAEQALGTIDVWISNAGNMPCAFLKDMDVEQWDAIINSNLRPVFLGGKIAYEKMRKKGGILINAASFAARMPSVGFSAYAAAKAGVVSLTQSFASELAPYGIRVLGYAPGFTVTNLNRKQAEMGDVLSPISMHRLGAPEDIAKVIYFMASDLSGYISGTCIEISGGKFSTQNPALAWDMKE